METSEVLIEGYGRIHELVHTAAEGLDADALTYRPERGSNSIAWLIWHLSRIQDDHVSEIAGRDQSWISGQWADDLGMEPDPTRLGYGDGPDDVAAVRPRDSQPLLDYHDHVTQRSVEYLSGVTAQELDRIIDRRWDPPVTVGVRLISVLSDNLQHAGQARYLRGMLERL